MLSNKRNKTGIHEIMFAQPLLNGTTTLVFLRKMTSVVSEVLNAVAVSYHIFIKDIFRFSEVTES